MCVLLKEARELTGRHQPSAPWKSTPHPPTQATRSQPCWHPDLNRPAPALEKHISVVHEPPHLWSFVLGVFIELFGQCNILLQQSELTETKTNDKH